MGKLEGSVLAGLDKESPARQGSNEGGHTMRYYFDLFLYCMCADGPLTLRGAYVGGLGRRIYFYYSSVFFHYKAERTQAQEMESGLFDV